MFLLTNLYSWKLFKYRRCYCSWESGFAKLPAFSIFGGVSPAKRLTEKLHDSKKKTTELLEIRQ